MLLIVEKILVKVRKKKLFFFMFYFWAWYSDGENNYRNYSIVATTT